VVSTIGVWATMSGGRTTRLIVLRSLHYDEALDERGEGIDARREEQRYPFYRHSYWQMYLFKMRTLPSSSNPVSKLRLEHAHPFSSARFIIYQLQASPQLNKIPHSNSKPSITVTITIPMLSHPTRQNQQQPQHQAH